MSYRIEVSGGSAKIPQMRETVHIGKMGDLDIQVDGSKDISQQGDYSDVLYAVSNATRQLDEKSDEKIADPLSMLTWKINILSGAISDNELPEKFKGKKLPPEYGTVKKLSSSPDPNWARTAILSYKKPVDAEASAQPANEQEGPAEIMMSAIIQYCSGQGSAAFGKPIMNAGLTDRGISIQSESGGIASIRYVDEKIERNISKDITEVNNYLVSNPRAKGFSIVLREGFRDVDDALAKFPQYIRKGNQDIGGNGLRSEN